MKRPARQLVVAWVLASLVVTFVFALVAKVLPTAGVWHPYIAALPGLALSGYLLLLYQYFRHYDELIRRLTTRALSASALAGIVTLIVSTTRASIGGYAEFSSALVMVVMAATFVLCAMIVSWQHR